MNANEKRQLAITAAKVRIGAVEAVYSAQSGHPGGALSDTDLLTYLYSKELNVDPANPKMENRDRLVLSKGHACPSLYAILALKGFFPYEELSGFRQYGHMLQGHPNYKNTPGIDFSSGSLGQGSSAASGMALAGKIGGKSYRVYTILGDGELQEGQVWEAAMFAAHNKLDNYCVIVDNNNLQIDGTVKDVCSPYPIDEKFAAFGFEVMNIDGHNFDEIEAAIEKAKTVKGKPCAIIAKTVKGKGVSFMENNAGWHGKAPNKEQFETAIAELKKTLAELEVE